MKLHLVALACIIQFSVIYGQRNDSLIVSSYINICNYLISDNRSNSYLYIDDYYYNLAPQGSGGVVLEPYESIYSSKNRDSILSYASSNNLDTILFQEFINYHDIRGTFFEHYYGEEVGENNTYYFVQKPINDINYYNFVYSNEKNIKYYVPVSVFICEENGYKIDAIILKVFFKRGRLKIKKYR